MPVGFELTLINIGFANTSLNFNASLIGGIPEAEEVVHYGADNKVLPQYGLPMVQGLTYTYGISTYPGTVVIRNFEGVSRSNDVQVHALCVFNQQLEGRAAYNYLNVYRKENGAKVVLPFNSRNRLMFVGRTGPGTTNGWRT
jgi:hypothetical protein